MVQCKPFCPSSCKHRELSSVHILAHTSGFSPKVQWRPGRPLYPSFCNHRETSSGHMEIYLPSQRAQASDAMIAMLAFLRPCQLFECILFQFSAAWVLVLGESGRVRKLRVRVRVQQFFAYKYIGYVNTWLFCCQTTNLTTKNTIFVFNSNVFEKKSSIFLVYFLHNSLPSKGRSLMRNSVHNSEHPKHRLTNWDITFFQNWLFWMRFFLHLTHKMCHVKLKLPKLGCFCQFFL